MPGVFGGGTVEIFGRIRLGKRRPWKLRLGNRGTVEEFAGAVGNRGSCRGRTQVGYWRRDAGLELEDR